MSEKLWFESGVDTDNVDTDWYDEDDYWNDYDDLYDDYLYDDDDGRQTIWDY